VKLYRKKLAEWCLVTKEDMAHKRHLEDINRQKAKQKALADGGKPTACPSVH
jgi:hypothetical protein